jgi:hypothetical protein
MLGAKIMLLLDAIYADGQAKICEAYWGMFSAYLLAKHPELVKNLANIWVEFHRMHIREISKYTNPQVKDNKEEQ